MANEALEDLEQICQQLAVAMDIADRNNETALTQAAASALSGATRTDAR